MHTAITPQRRREAKREILEQIKQGASVEQVRSESLLLIRHATIYRLLKRAQSDEERAFVDGLHDHEHQSTDPNGPELMANKGHKSLPSRVHQSITSGGSLRPGWRRLPLEPLFSHPIASMRTCLVDVPW